MSPFGYKQKCPGAPTCDLRYHTSPHRPPPLTLNHPYPAILAALASRARTADDLAQTGAIKSCREADGVQIQGRFAAPVDIQKRVDLIVEERSNAGHR